MPGQVVSYWCLRAHHTSLALASDAVTPPRWSCLCGLPAGQDQAWLPAPVALLPPKSHFDYVQERRTHAEGAALLDEALVRLRTARRPAAGRGPAAR